MHAQKLFVTLVLPLAMVARVNAQPPANAELKAEVEKLAAKDANTRRGAVETLGRQRDKSVVPDLTKALADPDGNVRGYAADSLGKLEDVAAVAALAKRVADDTFDVNWEKDAALNALRILDLTRVSPSLLEALESKNRNVRLWAVRQLAAQKDRTVVEALVKLLANKDAEVRILAADALGKIGNKAAVPALVQRVSDDVNEAGSEKDVALSALRALDLSKATPALQAALNSKTRTVRVWAVQRLSTQREKKVVDALIEVLAEKDGELRGFAAESLGKLEDTSAVAALSKQVADDTFEIYWEKDYMLAALRKLDVDAVTTSLLAALKSSNRAVRLWAVKQLAMQSGKNVVDALTPLLDGKDGEIRAYAAESLGKIGDKSAAAVLAKRVKDDESEFAAEKDLSLQALKKLDLAAVTGALVGAAESKNRAVRLWAVQRLHTQWDKATVEALSKVLNDMDGELRGYAADSLGKLGDKSAAPALIKRVADDNANVSWEKDAAIAALKKLAPDKIEEALQAAKKSSNTKVVNWATAQLAALPKK
jgi:HEAT repeat protein